MKENNVKAQMKKNMMMIMKRMILIMNILMNRENLILKTLLTKTIEITCRMGSKPNMNTGQIKTKKKKSKSKFLL